MPQVKRLLKARLGPGRTALLLGATATAACMAPTATEGSDPSQSWVPWLARRGMQRHALPARTKAQQVIDTAIDYGYRGHTVNDDAEPLLHPIFPFGNEDSWVPMPSPHQVWAHSCCTYGKLELALANPSITAIEADIRMGKLQTESGSHSGVPVMAHPPSRSSDLSFNDFLDKCIHDGGRHLKLDFKDIESIELCLPLLAEARPRLFANGQAVWINADILPGPGSMFWQPINAERLFQEVKEHCPGVHLSLGWSVNPLGRAVYSEADCRAMASLWKDYAVEMGMQSGGVVFAAALRLAEREPGALIQMLKESADSQLLLWTGTWEPPVRTSTVSSITAAFEEAGVAHRCGFDCKILGAVTSSSYTDGLMEKMTKSFTSCLARWTMVSRWTQLA